MVIVSGALAAGPEPGNGVYRTDDDCAPGLVCFKSARAGHPWENPRSTSPVRSTNPAFDDADELRDADATVADYVRLVAALLRADLSGTRPGAVLGMFASADAAVRDQLRFAAVDALADPALRAWIDASPRRVKGAMEVARAMTPPDVAAGENEAAEARVRAFSAWWRYPYQLIIVPGYTPPGLRRARPGVHPIARRRLVEAARAFREGQAPFVLLSGGNVRPRGTPYYEGLEMKPVLVGLGVPADAIIVDARARHSTTNLRNAGRFMLAHGLREALVTAPGGGIGPFDQAFYFAHAETSTFHARCERELGYRVGTLHAAGAGRAAYSPAPEVMRIDYRDPLDP